MPQPGPPPVPPPVLQQRGHAQNLEKPAVWANITSLNISKRRKTNTLEVRLDKEQGAGFSLNSEEIERLLRRLKVNSSQFSMVQACPERKNVVYITFAPGVDLKKFVNQTESLILKEGIRTTTIQPVGQREVSVTVYGLHPDTRDEAVIEYLNSHGVVNKKDPIVYSVYPGAPGSNILAGKHNGNRSYMVEIKRNMGSYHIIDGEKVSIRYRGQIKTCANCHQVEPLCIGKAKAKDCTAPRVLLSEHMRVYWASINFTPSTPDMNEVDTDEELEKVSGSIIRSLPQSVEPSSPGRIDLYSGIVVRGFVKDKDTEDIIKLLKESGLPETFGVEDLQIVPKYNSTTVNIHELQPDICTAMSKNIQGKTCDNKQLTVSVLVKESPAKSNPETTSAPAPQPPPIPQTSIPNPLHIAQSKPPPTKQSKFWDRQSECSDECDTSVMLSLTPKEKPLRVQILVHSLRSSQRKIRN